MGRRIVAGNGRVPARSPRILSRVQAPYVEETTKILLRLRIPSSRKRADSVQAPNCWEDPGPFESIVALANKVETTIVLTMLGRSIRTLGQICTVQATIQRNIYRNTYYYKHYYNQVYRYIGSFAFVRKNVACERRES